MIIYGKQPTLYILERDKERVKEIFLINGKKVDQQVFKKIRKSGVKFTYLDTKKAQAMARGGNHQGILADVEEVEQPNYKTVLKKSEFILLLHSITDMGNVGAIVRTAHSLGVDAVIITGVNSISCEKIVRSSAGAGFDIPIVHHDNLYDLLNEFKLGGFATYGATLNGEDIRKTEISEKRVLLLGSESEGLPNRAVSKLDKEVTITMDRDFDSLNVSVASAILIDRMR
jgi:23S rRNA (guanosine2251-2'-O)-methyltransferase